MHLNWVSLLAALPCIAARVYHETTDISDDSDLHVFISRPDLRPPKFSVKKYQSDQISPGYWFVAPYTDLVNRKPTRMYQTGQAGPHIYDGDGNLVWSGSHLFGDRPIFDFKMQECNGEPCLTFIVNEDHLQEKHKGGAGIIMDASYHVKDVVHELSGRGTFNMHEFSVTKNNTALMVTYSSQMFEFSIVHQEISGWLGNNGFREADIATGKTVFEWWALDHIHPSESLVSRSEMPGSISSSWDFFHLNSIDKNLDGDYLISARYTNCIYKISGIDGSIIWRLGGTKSSFKLDGFNFSSQHDARFHYENSTTTIISFFNNAADDHHATSHYSSAFQVALDLPSMTATLLHRWDRPDHRLTRLRGNAQLLSNSNVFVGWSENAFISEFNHNGNCLLEAQFTSHRFATYRAYKFNFTSAPSEPPALVAHAYGITHDTTTTVFHVSWNGATEINTWEFYSIQSDAPTHFLGSAKKTGFETTFMASGLHESVYAVALAANGTKLGRSKSMLTIVPEAWKSDSIDENTAHVEDASGDFLDNTNKSVIAADGVNLQGVYSDANSTPFILYFHQHTTPIILILVTVGALVLVLWRTKISRGHRTEIISEYKYTSLEQA